MRKALNDNPMVQLGVLALLALVVGFVLITQMNKGSSSSSPTASSEASAAPATPADSSATATTPSDATATAPSPTTDTGTAAPVAPAAGASEAAPPAGSFVAGPGLPEPVVSAYKDNKAIVLLVVRRGGIDDEAVKASVERMSGLSDVALFVTNAGHVSRYSRIASGVTLDRVPALIVLRPRSLTDGGMPEALVSYGFRGSDSVAQAIHDALYNGRTDLPYYPK